jgi:ABC-type multidrug transport system permease subunit
MAGNLYSREPCILQEIEKGLVPMYFQEQDFRSTQEEEKLRVPSPQKSKFVKNLVLLIITVAVSITLGVLFSLTAYISDGPERGFLGSFIAVISFLLFDFFMAWVLFTGGKKWTIYRLKTRMIVAAISTLIAVLFSYLLWAADNPFSTILSVFLFFLCINLLVNAILNRHRS